MSTTLTQTNSPTTVNLAVEDAGYPPTVAAAGKFSTNKCESITECLIDLLLNRDPSMKGCAEWGDAQIAVVSKDDKLWLKTPDGTLFEADKTQSSGVLKPSRNKGEVVLDQISASELDGQALVIKILDKVDADRNTANPGSRVSVATMSDKVADSHITKLATTRQAASNRLAQVNA